MINDSRITPLEPRNKVLLFLGSGVSYDSKMPSVEELTSTIFDINPAELKSIHPFNTTRSSDNAKKVTGAQEFLKGLRRYAAERGLEDINYEDLHSLCQKVEHFQYAPRKDPTIRGLDNFVTGLVAGSDYFKQNDSSLQQCAAEARRLIEYTVKQELLIPKRSPKNLDQVLHYVNIVDSENIDIITLNHDTLVEQILGQRKDWTDGFEESETVFYENDKGEKEPHVIDYILDETLYDSKKVRVVKPHGSCNWYQFSRSGSWKWGIPRNGFSEFVLDAEGRPISESPFDAGILSGSLTKERSYLFWHTGYMFRHAYRILQEYDRVICSGYGWKDFGINEMFIEWIQKSPQKRILILEDESGLNFKHVKKFIGHWTADYLGRTIIHPKWLSSTNPCEALKLLNVPSTRH